MARYVQLAHNRRVDGDTRAEVLLNLGREDRLDLAGLRRLAESITRLTDGPGAGPGAVEVLESRPLGATWAMDALWGRLGIAAALAGAVGPRRLGEATERAIFALVARRALASGREPDVARWASEDVWVPRLRRMDDDNAARAAEVVALADDPAALQDAVVSECAKRVELQLDRLFVLARRMRGPPDETGRPDVEIAVAVTRDGIPVRVWPAAPGARLGIAHVAADLRGASTAPATWVLDRSEASDADLRRLQRAGVHWIAGRAARDAPPAARAALSRPGRYRAAGRRSRVKETGDRGARRVIVLHDLAEAERERARRDEVVAYLKAELASLHRRPRRLTAGVARRRNEQAERLVREPPGARYLRRTSKGRLAVDRARIAADARLDGKHLLETSDRELSASDVAAGYRNLLRVQPRLRSLIAASPPPSDAAWRQDRARAHVLLCWLALLLIRVAEQATGRSFEHIEHELQRLHLVSLAGPEGRVEQTTPLTRAQRDILVALDIEPPPRVVPPDHASQRAA